jgi:hypothetical protein
VDHDETPTNRRKSENHGERQELALFRQRTGILCATPLAASQVQRIVVRLPRPFEDLMLSTKPVLFVLAGFARNSLQTGGWRRASFHASL